MSGCYPNDSFAIEKTEKRNREEERVYNYNIGFFLILPSSFFRSAPLKLNLPQ